MTEKHAGNEFAHSSSDLRKRAEEIFLKKEAPVPEDLKSLSPEEIRKTLHELRVHQIQLEMQDEELQLAQSKLNASRARYFDLYNLAPVSYLSLSGKGIILEANLTAATLLGVTYGSLVARPLSQYILPEDQDIYYLWRKQLLEIGKPQTCELRMVKSDGTLFWVHLESTATEDAEGALVWRVMLSDITKRRSSEEALRERVKELNCLYNISALIEKEVDLEKIFQGVVELLPGGWRHPQLACARIRLGEREFKTANFNPSAWTLAANILLAGKPVGAVELFYSEAGPVCEEGSFLAEERKLLQAIAERLGRVAERTQVAQELTQAKELQFRALIEMLPQKIFLKDRNSVYISCNTNYARDLKIEPEKIMGKTDYDFFPTQLAEKYRADDQRILKLGKTDSWEEEYQGIDAFLKKAPKSYIRMIKAPFRDGAGLFGFFWDISDEKFLEAEKKRVAALEATSEIKSRFTAMVAHELRSPLAVIKESLSIVLEGMVGSVSDEQKKLLEIAKNNTDRLGRLINNVLDFQRIEAGKVVYDIHENDLKEVMTEVLEAVSILSKKKGLVLKGEWEESFPKVKFDKDKLTQVLMNLLNNAIHNTESGGILLRAQLEKEGVHVEVRDEGPGIKAEDFHKLFQPFEQVEGHNRKMRGGTGLGLAISKEIVLAHHGKIWVESAVGKGSTFHFTIPL